MASLKGFTCKQTTGQKHDSDTVVKLHLLCEVHVVIGTLWGSIMIDNKSFPEASLNPKRQTIIKKKHLIRFLLFEQSHNFVFYLFLSFYFLFSSFTFAPFTKLLYITVCDAAINFHCGVSRKIRTPVLHRWASFSSSKHWAKPRSELLICRTVRDLSIFSIYLLALRLRVQLLLKTPFFLFNHNI